MRNDRMLVYEWEWQTIRISLDFRTIADVKKSLDKLEKYLVQGTGAEVGARLYRVNNLLIATKMGLRDKASKEELASMIFRTGEGLCIMPRPVWDREKELKKLQGAWKGDRKAFERIERDLKHRFFHGREFKIKTPEGFAKRKRNRPELWLYLQLMEEAKREEG